MDFTLILAGTVCLERILPVTCKQEAAYLNYSDSQNNSSRKALLRVCGPPPSQSRTSLGEVAQDQDFLFTFVEFLEVSARLFLQPIAGSLRTAALPGVPAMPAGVCILYKLAEGVFFPQVVNRDIKQY